MKNLFAIVLLVTAMVVTGCEKKPAPKPATTTPPPAAGEKPADTTTPPAK